MSLVLACRHHRLPLVGAALFLFGYGGANGVKVEGQLIKKAQESGTDNRSWVGMTSGGQKT
jgi:hypothetical protein